MNLANELDAGYRWVEAYDFWVEALRDDPSNGVGALATAQMLVRRIAEQRQHPKALHAVAGYYARLAALNTSRIEALAGPQASQMVSSLPSYDSAWQPPRLGDIKDEYLRFVASKRLALVGTVEGLDATEKRWDQLYVFSIHESLKSGGGIPAVFAMFNQIKADFCAARWLAYVSQTGIPPETSIYGDTLDYAVYGVKPSLLALAQRAALDVLDRVAVCINDYLAVGENPQSISFRTFWREKSGAWRPHLSDELAHQNRGIVALGELASDLLRGGYLESQTHLRNAGTHRFCVLHDSGDSPSRPSPAVEHYYLPKFLNETIMSLR